MARKNSRKSPSVASGSRGSGTGAVSQALRLRRWIDIQLKDVLEERARGNWTEEDEREWRRTKPYECETCNERSSTRYNNNRHKLNKHSTKKVLNCTFPGCKLVFTRPDNLAKHQKKHHSTSQNDPEDEPRDDVEKLASQFWRRFPIADDLPKKPVDGLRIYYTPGKLPFLPPEVISHYADYYFAPTAFHPFLPLLHKPTFQPTTVLASFLRSVCALGGRYDPTNQTLREQLWEAGLRVMERWIERGPDDGGDQEPPPSMSPPPLVKTESSQAMVHPHPPSSSAGDGDRQSVKYADRSQREGTLCVLQGLLLFAFYGLFSEEKEKHKKGRVLLARAIARDYEYFNPAPGHIPQELPADQQWKTFVDRESRKRVAFTIYLVDCYASFTFETPRLLRYTELRNLPLPCDAQLFEAPTAQAWHQKYYTMRIHGSRMVPPPLFLKTLRILLNGNGHHELLDAGGLGSNFSALILATAIQMEILDLTRKVADDIDAQYETGILAPEEGAIWEGVDVFAPESQEGLEKLRMGLTTLGLISGIGNLFTPYTEHIPVFPPVTTYASTSPTLLASALQGCEKAFYILMHLALIQLVIPDRMVLHKKDVPMDLYTALASTVHGAKARVAANSPATLQHFMLVLDQSHVLSHLLSLLRVLLAPQSAYDENARNTEFPIVTVLIFKALMVVWEIIVRVENQPSPQEEMYLWHQYGLDGNPNQVFAQDIVVKPIEAFRYELLGLLTQWEARNEETEGLESLEWRYLRWMKAVFIEMEQWGVGGGVVQALDYGLYGNE
ncbi:fungal-specific transcription factor domain-domain-containing protein [Tuber borchii]|uniref:Fungal-specific transcription factor domain-domain-containing protein n=1 Tax=Tuber borchii TaxID=42251 RepID=A0A2T6ZUR1_TUBBO|nr:fungal-specific transcription factor domain-domain-containing protein [Tuber borchii]